MKKTFILITLFSLITSCSNNLKNEENKEPLAVVEEKIEQPKAIKGYDIGDTATDFSLVNIDGRMVSFSDYPEAQGFILIFTCNHCPYSVLYEDRIIALDKKYKSLGFPVIAINPNDPNAEGGEGDDFESMKVRAKNKSFTFPYLYDEGQLIYPQYGATKTPHTFVLQKTEHGNIVKYIGAIDDDKDGENIEEKYVEMAVDALLAGNEIETPLVPAIGCSIKTNN